jgi:hypothetical protein
MSDYFFYDLNKKMADLANKQQLAEDVQTAPAKPAHSALRTQLNERDLGKHNNATTGFAALAKKTGGGEKGARIAGAQLAKMRAKGQVEEEVDESALQAAFGKKKYGDQGMKALQKAGRDHAGAKTMSNIRNKYDKYDEGMTDEGNAFSGAVARAKADGIQPGEKIQVGGKQYELKEVDATPQDVASRKNEIRAVNAPAAKASAASAPKPNPNVPGSMIKVGPDTGPVKKTQPPKVPGYNDSVPVPDPSTPVKEAAKWRAPEHKGKLYTQKKGDSDEYDSISYGYEIPERPKKDPGQKRRMGGVGDEFSRTDPLTKGFGRSGTGSPVEKGPRKGLPKRDQITSLKGSIKDVLGKHTEPNLPEGGAPMTPKQQKFAKLAPPVDKITFADKIVGAKKEVDEMLGDVAANAMKNAVGKMRGRNRDMEESFLDDEPTNRKSSTGGRIDTSQSGVTRHHAGKSYSGAGHDAGAEDEPSGAVGRRKVGAGMGKKIGAKINRGTSKLMTKEGDMPEDMIEPQDSGEYDQEGEMAKDDIKTVVRHAQALEKILGDNDNLPEWVQAKLAKIEGMMTAVDDYMQNQKSSDMEMDEESTNKRDNRAEKAGRKVAKDIEYDEKKKDGIHGKRRGSEDSKAERAGKKVTKDIEYDEKKDKKKKEVDETTSSGSVATGATAPKSGGSMSYGKGIYDSLNRQLENMISESMNINMSMNNDEHGGPKKSLTVTATDEDAVMLAGLLKMAGMEHGDEHIHAMTGDDSDMQAIHDVDHEHGDEPCADCGQTTCECYGTMEEDRWGAEQTPKLPYDMTVVNPEKVDVSKSGDSWVYKPKEPGGRVTATIPASTANKMFPMLNVDEAYGDTDATQNEPDWPTDQEGTEDAMMYSGGLDGPKSTGQTTVPVIGGQDDRMGYEGDHELRRMMEIAGLR